MIPSISQRGKDAPASPVRKLVPFADEAKAKGITVYHVNIGDPDFLLPEKIIDTLQEVAKNTTRLPYANARGLAACVNAWISYYNQIGISLTKEQVLVTNGGSEGLILVCATLFDPGDDFLVFEPFYANYNSFGNLVSAKAVPVSLDPNNGYHLPSKEEIVKHTTPQTKAIFFTNPNNPTGTVFTQEEIALVLEIAQEHNLFIVSDETYRGMCFDGKKSLSVFAVATPEQVPLLIVTDSVSKRLNACGARVGLIVTKNAEVMDSLFRFAQGRLSVPYLEQEIIAPQLADSLKYVDWLTKQYEKRRDSFIQTLEKELQITIHKPEGAFYTMVQLPVEDTDDFAKWLLTDFSDNNETVMVAPGAGFYATPGKGKNEIRVAYVLSEEKLQRAAQLLALGVKKYLEK